MSKIYLERGQSTKSNKMLQRIYFQINQQKKINEKVTPAH